MIKQTYKLQEPKSSNFKRVISTSYSTNVGRPRHFKGDRVLNSDISEHLGESPDKEDRPTENPYSSTSGPQPKTNKNRDGNFSNQMNLTQRQTVDVNGSHNMSAQFNVVIGKTGSGTGLPTAAGELASGFRFQNAMLTQELLADLPQMPIHNNQQPTKTQQMGRRYISQ